jgi:predicted  nucleic acid-binding Zn-ribbon protein
MQVDIARETAIENIHKASNKLMSEIDKYERECLSSWKANKASTDVNVKDLSKRARELLAKQHALLQSVQKTSDEADEIRLQLDEANKLVQKLSNRKRQLKSFMFGNRLALFQAFPSIDDPPSLLGEFTHIQLPFDKVDFTTSELKPADIRVINVY